MASMPDADRITIARLDGAARRLLQHHAPLDQAVAELRAVTTRPDLLAYAAGTALGAWRHDHVVSWQGQAIAQLLIAAGAQPEQAEHRAAEVAHSLHRESGRR